MEIIKLPLGTLAADETDCIKINELLDGKFSLVASVIMACGDGDEIGSVALVASEPYPSYEDAEQAGLAWAEDHCVPVIYVETGGHTEPLRR